MEKQVSCLHTAPAMEGAKNIELILKGSRQNVFIGSQQHIIQKNAYFYGKGQSPP
jgi:hypothetical protein